MPYTYHVPCHTPGTPIKASKTKYLYINARSPGRADPLWLWLQVSSYLVALDHPGYTARMSLKRPRSLKKLILGHEIAILFLVTVTGLIGGLSAYFWQQNSAESVRINAMFYFTEQIRGELYAQIQTMIRARVLQDPRALPSARPACGRPDFPQDRALSCITERPILKKPLHDTPHAVSVS